jgi:hypothetical protein
MDAYDKALDKKREDRLDHGNMYCSWPNGSDDYADRYAILVEAFGEEKLIKMLEEPAAPRRTMQNYYRDKFHYEQSEKWFAGVIHDVTKKWEEDRKAGAGVKEPQPQPILRPVVTYDDLPF